MGLIAVITAEVSTAPAANKHLNANRHPGAWMSGGREPAGVWLVHPGVSLPREGFLEEVIIGGILRMIQREQGGETRVQRCGGAKRPAWKQPHWSRWRLG